MKFPKLLKGSKMKVAQYELTCPYHNLPLESIEEKWEKREPAWKCPKCDYSVYLDIKALKKNKLIEKVEWIE